MLDIPSIRGQFPGLARNGIFFDGPGGSQAPRRVVDAVADYLVHKNANTGGIFATARQSDALLDEAHRAAADFLGTTDPGEIVFGQNMTTHTFAISRALAKTWRAGDEVIVTRLDHDANVSPWVLAARDAGATVKFVPVRHADCTLDLDALRAMFSPRTKLVAVGCASNAVGSINPVKQIAAWAHAVGALVYLDAVHYAPHASIDVKDWDCDFLACSAYKFFGPHVGMLYGKRKLLESLPAYKVRPCTDELPMRWETGTLNHEGIAGTLAAIEYLASIGRSIDSSAKSRRAAIVAAYRAIGEHETELTKQFLRGIKELKSVQLFGIADAARLSQRTPTFAVRHAKLSPNQLNEHLSRHEIYAWCGTFYALELMESLKLDPPKMVRVGMLHYNTADEVAKLLEVLREVD